MTPHLLAGPASCVHVSLYYGRFFSEHCLHTTPGSRFEDSEWVATAKLGRAWKDLSKKSDAELGIDPNTRVQE